MIQYGQAEGIDDTLLNVGTSHPNVVDFQLHNLQGFPLAFLNPHEVKLLITQLETWLSTHEKVCPTCGK